MAFNTNSDLKGALVFSYTLYLFSVAAFRVGFRLLANLCRSMRDDRDPCLKIKPTKLLAVAICILFVILYIAIILVFTKTKLGNVYKAIPPSRQVAFVAGAVVSAVALPIMISMLDFRLREDDIKEKRICLRNNSGSAGRDEELKPLNSKEE